MIGAYLIVFGVLAMAVGYVSLMYWIVTRAEARDLAALNGTPLASMVDKTKTAAVEVPTTLAAAA